MATRIMSVFLGLGLLVALSSLFIVDEREVAIIAMPYGHPPSQQAGVETETLLQIIEQRLDGTDVDDAQAPPVLRQHP